MERPRMQTQFTWQLDEVEKCAKFPSLTDPDSEVYTVAELIARHERGIFTNLNIGRDVAYPTQAFLNDRDLEKDMNQEPTDRFHLANELEDQLNPLLEKQREEKRLADEKAAKEKADAEFNARLVAEGYTKASAKGDEGKT